ANVRRVFELRGPKGEALFRIKWMDAGAKLVDSTNREIARIKPHEDRIKITDAKDVVIGALTGDADKLNIKAGDKEVQFVLRHQPDGDYRLEDAHDSLLVKIKRKEPDYLRGEDAAGKTLFKAKRKQDKLVITNASETVIFSAQGAGSLLGFAMFGIDRL